MSGLPVKINPETPPHSLYERIEYEEFWNGQQKRELDKLEQSIIKDLIPISGCRIIDVGCGYGRLADCYMNRFQQVIMVDGSMSLLRQAYEKTGGRAIYIACDVTHLPFRSNSFNTVLMVRVFHHIENSQAFLSELHRLLCNNGHFIFSFCNKQNMKRVFHWLMGDHTNNPFSIDPVGIGSTLISHHPSHIISMLIESGFHNFQNYGVGVFDKITGRFGFLGILVSLEKRFARVFGSCRISPWIISRSIAKTKSNLLSEEKKNDQL